MSPDAFFAAAALIGKALGLAALTALLCLLAIGGVVSLFEGRDEDAEALRRLAQRTRSEFIRRGRWVTAEQIREDLQEMEPPFYDEHSFSN